MGKCWALLAVTCFAAGVLDVCEAYREGTPPLPPPKMVDPDAVWPDFTCHRAYDEDSVRPNRLKTHKRRWENCKNDEAKTGECARVCILRGDYILYQRLIREGEVVFDYPKLVDSLSQENGYTDNAKNKDYELLKTVTRRMEDCALKHTEIDDFNVFENCSRWNPLLDCIHQGYGC